MNATNIATFTQRQWFQRPADEKFASVEELHAFLTHRRSASHVVNASLKQMQVRVDPTNSDDIVLTYKDGVYTPTNWSFGQLCALTSAHPTFLRELPANLTADVLNHCLHERGRRDNVGLLIQQNGKATLRATTSQSYGRIWDNQLSQAALEILDRTNGQFYSPHDWGKEKRALFASDRDVHMLFIDGGSIVDGGLDAKGNPDQLNRGWIIGNSEVGLSAWYFATFLFRWVCGNFAIHGLEEVRFLKLIHTPSAPGRFAQEALPAIQAYTQASPRPLEQIIAKAKEYRLPKGVKEFESFFKVHGFTGSETMSAKLTANREEGGSETLWQMVNGFTKAAQRIPYRNERRNLETKAGGLLKLAA